MTDELDFRDVMEAVDYHVKACLDRAAGEPLDTASTRAKVAEAIAAWSRRAQPEPATVKESLTPDAAPSVEPVAHMYPSDLERFPTSETFATAYSVAVGSPDERSVPLFAHPPRAPLTEAEVVRIWGEAPGFDSHRQEAIEFARAIEAAHGISAERGEKP